MRAPFPATYCAQSSSTSPGIHSNSLVLFVTSTAPAAMACPAIAVSLGPIGVPARRHFNLSGGVHRSAVPGQNGIEAGSEGILQLLSGRS